MDENITISPMIAYSFALSDDADEAISIFDEGGDPTKGASSVLYGGVGISVGLLELDRYINFISRNNI